MKVNVPLLNGNGDRNRHSLTHQMSTTSDFGFVQPILMNEVESNSTNKFRIGQVVQASPMVKPVFGDIRVKTYNSFVPIADIWHAYESFLNHQAYNGAFESYIPSYVPCFELRQLTEFVHEFGQWCIFEDRDGDTPVDFQPSAGGTDISILNCHSVPRDISGEPSPYSEALNYFANFMGYEYGIPRDQVIAAYDNSQSGFTCAYNSSLTPYSCDWYIYIPYAQGSLIKSFLVGGRYSQFGKNLVKICSGLGLPLSMSNGKRSILPLVAYYKAWFDLFVPKRKITWKNTNAFKLMELIEQHGYTDFSPSHTEQYTAFQKFVKEELPDCYYTDNVDYVSAHVTGVINDIAEYEEKSYVDFDKSGTSLENNTTGDQAFLGNAESIGQVGLNVLKAVTRRLNIRSWLGGDLAAQLRSIFGSEYRDEKQSNFIGSQSISLQLEKVVSTAQTEEGFLAEFAGKGEGRNGGDTFTFNATCPGYIITLMCIVPNSNYSQGTDQAFLRRWPEDFWAKDYDSITLETSRKANIYGQIDCAIRTTDNNLEQGFGNKPLYLEYKTKLNRLGGEFSMLSLRTNLLPYTLDKLLPLTDVNYDADLHRLHIRNFDRSVLVAGDQWRYIGLYPWIGNQRRIFINEDIKWHEYGQHRGWVENYMYEREDDNFVVHCYFEYDKFSGALAVADSWQTEAYGEHLSQELA